MARQKTRRSGATRDAPAAKSQRSMVWLGDWGSSGDLACKGYRSLSQCPEIVAGVDKIAALIGSMTIHLMRNGDLGDERIKNGLSRLVDIAPNPYMVRGSFIRWIVRTLYLDGDGNAVVYPTTRDGYLERLDPVPAAYVSFQPDGMFGYRVTINGKPYQPEDVLHFVRTPGSLYPWQGVGVKVALRDVLDNLQQAAATTKGFMASKWKPSVIVKVDALTQEFSSPEGRRKLLDSYIQTAEAGEPWLIPSEQFAVEQIKPLSIKDLAISEAVTLDKRTVASILDVPPFVLGVGDYNKDAWNNFVDATIMPLAHLMEQELTRKLLYSPDYFFRFNPRSLYAYSLQDTIKAGAEMVDRMAMSRNEWREWVNLAPREDMEEMLGLENYIPVSRLGDQKKLEGGDTSGT